MEVINILKQIIMRIEISFKSLYFSKRLYYYFFCEQSRDTLEDLIYFSKVDTHSVLRAIDSYAEQNDYNIDDIDEMLYNESVEDIAKELGIELQGEDEEEEE